MIEIIWVVGKEGCWEKGMMRGCGTTTNFGLCFCSIKTSINDYMCIVQCPMHNSTKNDDTDSLQDFGKEVLIRGV